MASCLLGELCMWVLSKRRGSLPVAPRSCLPLAPVAQVAASCFDFCCPPRSINFFGGVCVSALHGLRWILVRVALPAALIRVSIILPYSSNLSALLR